MTEIEFGADADWSGWATPDVGRPARRGAGRAGRRPTSPASILDVAGFGTSWELAP